MSTPCPNGCGRSQPTGKFLCRTCWGLVPEPLQHDVYATWRELVRLRRRSDPLGRSAAVRAYRRARDAALEAIA